MAGQLKRMNPVKRFARRSLRRVGIGKPFQRGELNGILMAREATLGSIDTYASLKGRVIANEKRYSVLGDSKKEKEIKMLNKQANVYAADIVDTALENSNKDLFKIQEILGEAQRMRTGSVVGKKRLKKAGPFVRARLKRTQNKGIVLLGGKKN